MLYTKDGFPDVNEIVKCTVTKIYGNTTFVTLDEYEKEGVLTISEIAPGRIRNLRDHVVENKVIVCKVLRVDEKQNRIDVSLRRVPVPVMREKLETIKKEEYSERIYVDVAKQIQCSKDELFEKTYEPIFENYETVFEALYEIMLDNKKIDMFSNLNDREKEIFIEIINLRIKPEEVTFRKKFKLSSDASEGVDLIKNSIENSLAEINYNRVEVVYLAAGEFAITIKHDEMKLAAKFFDKFKLALESRCKKNNMNFQI